MTDLNKKGCHRVKFMVIYYVLYVLSGLQPLISGF